MNLRLRILAPTELGVVGPYALLAYPYPTNAEVVPSPVVLEFQNPPNTDWIPVTVTTSS